METIGIRYTKSDIKKIRESNRIVATVHKELSELIQEGVTTKDLDSKAEEIIEREGGKPAFKGYKGFPYTICASVNETIVHGFPTDYKLKEGDLISVDVGVIKNGFFGDACVSTVIGRNRSGFELVEKTNVCLTTVISVIKDGITTGTIGNIIQSIASSSGYDVVKEYVGHSIGCILHDVPHIKNYGKPGFGFTLKEGMIVCIEPMLTEGSAECYRESNGWEVKTLDGKLAAHAEHCVLITKSGCEILSVC